MFKSLGFFGCGKKKKTKIELPFLWIIIQTFCLIKRNRSSCPPFSNQMETETDGDILPYAYVAIQLVYTLCKMPDVPYDHEST